MDATLLFSWQGDAFRKYRPGFSDSLQSVEDWRGRIEALATLDRPPEIEVIVHHRSSGFPMGAMCLSAIDERNLKAELSVGFFRGRGSRAVWEAIHIAFHYAFVTLALRKLIFYTLIDNGPALAVLRQLGARSEGILVDELTNPLDGGRLSLERHAIFRDRDWPAISARLSRVAPLALSDD